MWLTVREPVCVTELTMQLEAEYEAAPGEIEADVLRTLGEFAAEGLIQVCAPGQ
jgi:hypothetical protein